MDWGAPASSTTVDWSTPASGFDWGAPVLTQASNGPDEFKLEWEDEDNKNDEDEDSDEGIQLKKSVAEEKSDVQEEEEINSKGSLDIMAQQLKFIACLKILMEELSTLATGFEVDGGQLRYQLYVWLEREVEALKQLCNYSSGDSDHTAIEDNSNLDAIDRDTPVLSNKFPHDKPTLHEILIQEKQDFEAKVQRAARRKRWLKANETLLRTLLSYCSLHGASGGGLASVRMELVLLL